MATSRVPRALLSLSGLLFLATTPARPQDRCSQAAARRPLVTEDSVGFLPVRASFQTLRGLCPSARDTVLFYEESSPVGLSFHFGNVVVVASQTSEDLVPSEPPEFWVISGSEARLPMGMTLSSTWGQLRATYGASTPRPEPGVVVKFCRYPRLLFSLRYPAPEDWGATPIEQIPDSVHVGEVWIDSKSYVPPPCARRR
jgi:hypothetical protein